MKRYNIVACLAVLMATRIAPADIIGKVKSADQGGVTLDIGPKLPWSTRLTTPQRKSLITRHGQGSLVRLKVEVGKVVSMRSTDINPETIKTIPWNRSDLIGEGFALKKDTVSGDTSPAALESAMRASKSCMN